MSPRRGLIEAFSDAVVRRPRASSEALSKNIFYGSSSLSRVLEINGNKHSRSFIYRFFVP